MLFREKNNLTTPGGVPGLAFYSSLKSALARSLVQRQAKLHPELLSLQQDFGAPECSPELLGLVDALKSIRRRILANSILNSTAAWAAWILIGLIVIGAVSARLVPWVIFAAVLAATGLIAILVWTMQTRPSIYDAACQLDAAAVLQDRVSTAIYLGDVKAPDGMIQHQRTDATSRVAKVDPVGFFPLRMPAFAVRALVLALMFIGLFAYRIHHKPPLVALLQSTARSSLVQSIFTPLVHAMERDLQRTMAMANIKPEPQADEVRPGDGVPTADNLWPTGDENSVEKAQTPEGTADASDNPAQDGADSSDDQNGLPSADAQQQDAESESQTGKSGSDNEGDTPTPANAQGSQSDKQSLAQSMMQALKNMMNSPKQQSKSRNDSKQAQNPNGAPQSGDSHQPGTSESDRSQQSRGNSDAEEKASKSSSSGAGSQQGSKEMQKDQTESHSATATPDRVALEASGFKEQTRMKTETDAGTAKLGVRDGASQSQAVINGAEQENIPARYRLYVQHYFEHVDSTKQ